MHMLSASVIFIVGTAAAAGGLLADTAVAFEGPGRGFTLSRNGVFEYDVNAADGQIPNFSAAGYNNGEQTTPSIETKIRVEPSSSADEDATPRIQAAIDQLGKLSRREGGWRGAVELGPGVFNISGALDITISGIVLRGSGKDRTTIRVRGNERTIVSIGQKSNFRLAGTERKSIVGHVQVGQTWLKVSDTNGLKVGDRVIVQRPATSAWIAKIGMNNIPPRRDGSTIQWREGSGTLMERVIRSINGDWLELDSAVVTSIDNEDQGTVWPYAIDGEVQNIGVEGFAAENVDAILNDSDPFPWRSIFLEFNAVKNAWLRDVKISGFAGSIYFSKAARNIAAHHFDVDSLVKSARGGAVPTAVSIAGQKIHVSHCLIKGKFFLAVATQSWAAGPNVVQYCSIEGAGASVGAHQRWATGLLLDNLKVSDAIALDNRGNMGTGQGWTAADSVVWNSICSRYLIESPPTASNWAAGVIGRVTRASQNPGISVSAGQRVLPDSLYDAQLRDRELYRSTRH